MIKKIIGITTLLFLSVFLITPVQAAAFTKTTGIEPDTLDYKNSLIDWYGYNVDIDFIKSTAGGLNPQAYVIQIYVDAVQLVNRTLSWEDIGNYEYKAILSSNEKNIIKTILFSRSYSLNNSVRIYPRNTTQTTPFAAYWKLEFKSLMNINFSSVYIADFYSQPTAGLINNFVKSITLLDRFDTVIYSSGQLDDNTTQTIGVVQKALYNFNDVYTNVKTIFLGFQLSSNAMTTPTYLEYAMHSIGLFADSQVILPDLDIDTDFQIYQPTICGIADLACISRNLMGELSNTLYNRLGAENIASSILDIYDTLFYPVYIINNSSWQNAILAIYIMLPIGIIIMIVKRVT